MSLHLFAFGFTLDPPLRTVADVPAFVCTNVKRREQGSSKPSHRRTVSSPVVHDFLRDSMYSSSGPFGALGDTSNGLFSPRCVSPRVSLCVFRVLVWRLPSVAHARRFCRRFFPGFSALLYFCFVRGRMFHGEIFIFCPGCVSIVGIECGTLIKCLPHKETPRSFF